MSIVSILRDAHAKLDAEAQLTPTAGREFAIAKTHIEDAITRINKGMAIKHKVSVPLDVEADAAAKS